MNTNRNSTSHIRRLTEADWDTFRQIRLKALAEAAYAFSTKLEDAQKLSESAWRQRLVRCVQFIAYVEGVAVGTAGGMADADPSAAELVSMWVDPSARHLGVGSHLVRTIVDWAREQGFREVRLWVAEENRAAERLYAQSGFVHTGERQPIHPEQPARQEVAMVYRYDRGLPVKTS